MTSNISKFYNNFSKLFKLKQKTKSMNRESFKILQLSLRLRCGNINPSYKREKKNKQKEQEQEHVRFKSVLSILPILMLTSSNLNLLLEQNLLIFNLKTKNVNLIRINGILVKCNS